MVGDPPTVHCHKRALYFKSFFFMRMPNVVSLHWFHTPCTLNVSYQCLRGRDVYVFFNLPYCEEATLHEQKLSFPNGVAQAVTSFSKKWTHCKQKWRSAHPDGDRVVYVHAYSTEGWACVLDVDDVQQRAY